MINPVEWQWKGWPGHYVDADRCGFRLHTRVGKYRISTVGCRYINGHIQEIGSGRHYETMVFLETPDGEVANWQELEMVPVTVDGTRTNEGYDKQAEANHIAVCLKYATDEIQRKTYEGD